METYTIYVFEIEGETYMSFLGASTENYKTFEVRFPAPLWHTEEDDLAIEIEGEEYYLEDILLYDGEKPFLQIHEKRFDIVI
jgi:hypothetical protein